MEYNTDFSYTFKQCSSKYRKVPLITLGCRSPDHWKVDIYNCSLFDKWCEGCLGFFTCLILFKEKKCLERKDTVCIMD